MKTVKYLSGEEVKRLLALAKEREIIPLLVTKVYCPRHAYTDAPTWSFIGLHNTGDSLQTPEAEDVISLNKDSCSYVGSIKVKSYMEHDGGISEFIVPSGFNYEGDRIVLVTDFFIKALDGTSIKL